MTKGGKGPVENLSRTRDWFPFWMMNGECASVPSKAAEVSGGSMRRGKEGRSGGLR